MDYFFDINIINPPVTLQKLYGGNAKDEDGKEAAVPAESGGNEIGESPKGNRGKEPEEKNSETGENTEKSENRQEGLYMTSEELTFLTRIDFKDKLTALSILAKLEKEDKDKIIQISLDGVTYSEYYEIEAILKNRLTQEDIEKLRSILDKNRELYAQGSR